MVGFYVNKVDNHRVKRCVIVIHLKIICIRSPEVFVFCDVRMRRGNEKIARTCCPIANDGCQSKS